MSSWIPAAGLLALLCLAVPGDDPFHIRSGRDRVIEDAVADLSHRDFGRRERALRRLLSLGEAARNALDTARGSPEAEVRHRAAIALRSLDERRLSPSVRRERDFVRVIRIGLMPGRDLRPGSNRFTALGIDRGAAARAGARVGRDLESRPVSHRRVVALLVDLGHESAGPYLAELLARGYPLASTLHLATRGLEKFAGPEVLPEVRSAVDADTHPIARKYALHVLSVKGSASDLPLILRAAADLDPGVRAAAARAAGLLGGRRAVADLRGLLLDEEPAVRIAAIESLGRIPTDTVTGMALELLGDTATEVRVAALRVLSRRAGPGELPAIEPLLVDLEDRVRAAAVTAMARLGGPEFAARRGLPDSSPRVRRAALVAALSLSRELRLEIISHAGEEHDPYLRLLRRHVARTN